jgi:tetratricopeptide (TPR) repeat protein
MTPRLQACLILCCAALCGCNRSTEVTTEPGGKVSTVTFAHDVAPIVFAHCATCHHPGEAAPFSLLTYDDCQRRARQIVELTQKRFMPPWLPNEGENHFAGARTLSDRELKTLKTWVDSGTPRGDESQLPPTPVFADGWQFGTPDLVLESPAYSLAGAGADVFRNFVVPIELAAPRWVESIELRPENPRATHHARLGVDNFNESIRRDAEDEAPGYDGMAWAQDPEGQLVIWAPGLTAHAGTPGVAWRLLPNTCLVLHTHMQPTGKPETVKFQIGIHFAKEAPTENPVMLRVGSCEIDIPAGAAHHTVTDEYVLPIDIDLHNIFPHAHSLCSTVHVVAVYSDGSQRPLVSIEHFDENWHDLYRFAEPIRLPRGAKIRSTFVYDNSDANVRNRHHPPERTVYGSNADDEMADGYLQATPVRPDERAVLVEHYQKYDRQLQIAGYRKAIEGHRDSKWDLEALATNYIGLGKPQEAIAILEQRLQIGQPAVYPLASLGMAYSASGNFLQAESQFRQAIALDEKYALAWFGLGKALVGQEKLDAAEQAFRRALEVAPGLPEVRIALADLLMRRGQLEEAARECTVAIADAPDSAEFHLKLAEIHAKQNRNEESLELCGTARRLAPYTHPPKVLLAVYRFQSGDLESARALLQQASVEFAKHPAPPLFLGQLAMQEKRTEEARKFFAQAAAQPIPGNWPDSHRRRFLALLHTGRLQLAEQLRDAALAREALAELLKLDPDDRRLKARQDQLRTAVNR